VVKIGGSLFDLPDLGRRLRLWLESVSVREVLLVPGGGPTADLVRDLDRLHGLGEEASHWLALRALTLNAHFLAGLLPSGRAEVVEHPAASAAVWPAGRIPVLDGHRFADLDEGCPGCLPHCWSVTSDALAARAAIVAGASRLVLLKSVTFPPGLSWAEAGQRGLVDGYFATAIGGTSIEVQAINFRTWAADRRGVGP
jgi:aspartokinase-like uncharacterized kinase